MGILWLIIVVIIILVYLLLTYTIFFSKVVCIVRFSSKTCPYCIQSQDEWQHFKQHSRIQTVDIDVNLYNKYKYIYVGKKIVPTIYAVYGNDYYIEYTGNRTCDDLIKWSSKF